MMVIILICVLICCCCCDCYLLLLLLHVVSHTPSGHFVWLSTVALINGSDSSTFIMFIHVSFFYCCFSLFCFFFVFFLKFCLHTLNYIVAIKMRNYKVQMISISRSLDFSLFNVPIINMRIFPFVSQYQTNRSG